MFPNNAKTIRVNNESGTDQLGLQILPVGTRTILSITINSNDNRDNSVFCNGVQMMLERRAEFQQQLMSWPCDTAIIGNLYRHSSIAIVYTDYDLAQVPMPVSISTTELITSADKSFYIDKTITYGDTILITFLLIFFVLLATKILWNFVKQDATEKL
jgi:hypothetical protein